jgi:hypothetical protein
VLEADRIICMARADRGERFSDDAARRIAAQLGVQPGETVLWLGRPFSGLLLTEEDMLRLPYDLPLIVFALLFLFVGWNFIPADAWFRIFAVLFITKLAYNLFGRHALDAWIRRQTRYGVTDRRILIARSGLFRRNVALERNRLPEMHMSETWSGHGTLRFGPDRPTWTPRNWQPGPLTPTLDRIPRFIAIPNARRVRDLIQATISGGNEPGHQGASPNEDV